MPRKENVKRNIIEDIARPKGYEMPSENTGCISDLAIVDLAHGLKPPDQKLLRLYYIEQKSHQELAQVFSCSVETIRHRQQRILHFLRLEFNPVYKAVIEKAREAV